ncbi:hypothetical protein ER308_07135 [Egibacter rhizosphaerae]|uniref:Uncharacterized protein n=1 Tax=Egibacter rhizosphaerae TaxID=1670831 RepID=A0A411YDT8_9ACTN|nr:hypothetical protein [Egibacter rhizosphaerae]QBI19340.1 hypothetical protein ER308_07135 [Egibacter rhizosphaerae]
MSDITGAADAFDENQPPEQAGVDPAAVDPAGPTVGDDGLAPPVGGQGDLGVDEMMDLAIASTAASRADQDFEQPTVITGFRQETRQEGRWPEPIAQHMTTPGPIRRETVEQRRTPEEAAQSVIGNAPERELREYQRKLYAGGFYQEPFEDIRWGFGGPETLSAAMNFFEFAAHYREPGTGEELPFWDVLERVVDSSGGMDDLEDDPDHREPAPMIDLQDPEAIGHTVDDTFRQVAGRRATDEEKRAFVSLTHRLQRERQMTQHEYRAALQRQEAGMPQRPGDEQFVGHPEGETQFDRPDPEHPMRGAPDVEPGEPPEAVETEGVDVAARAREFVEEQAPGDVLDREARQAHQAFRGMATRGRGV